MTAIFRGSHERGSSGGLVLVVVELGQEMTPRRVRVGLETVALHPRV